MGKKEDDEIFKLYNDLLASEYSSPDYATQQHSKRFIPDDEAEDFITGEDLARMSKEDAEKFREDGILPKTPTTPVQIEEELHFKRFTQQHQHKYSEKEMEEIREACSTSIVHDYGENDYYHMSDEDRAKNDSLNELRLKLNGLKTMYRQIDKYIEAMRVVVQAWEILSKDNYIHTDEEFYKMVYEGKIYNSSIVMPKMQHLDRYNIDLVIRYISNPELDPHDLVPTKPKDDWYNQFDDDAETEEEQMERLLSPEEVQYVMDHVDNPETIKVHDIKPKYIRGYDQKNVYGSKKQRKKKFNKRERYLVENLHSLLNKIQSNPANRDSNYGIRSYLVTSSMFEPAKEIKNPIDEIRYDGSWTNKADLFFYDLAVEEERLKQPSKSSAYMTVGDQELQDFFRVMEQNGISAIELRRRMNMSDEHLEAARIQRERKENKKAEAALLQRITKLNENPKFKKLVRKAEDKISSVKDSDFDN